MNFRASGAQFFAGAAGGRGSAGGARAVRPTSGSRTARGAKLALREALRQAEVAQAKGVARANVAPRRRIRAKTPLLRAATIVAWEGAAKTAQIGIGDRRWQCWCGVCWAHARHSGVGVDSLRRAPSLSIVGSEALLVKVDKLRNAAHPVTAPPARELNGDVEGAGGARVLKSGCEQIAEGAT